MPEDRLLKAFNLMWQDKDVDHKLLQRGWDMLQKGDDYQKRHEAYWWSCDCLDAKNRHRTCKHMLAEQIQVKALELQIAQEVS